MPAVELDKSRAMHLHRPGLATFPRLLRPKPVGPQTPRRASRSLPDGLMAVRIGMTALVCHPAYLNARLD